MPRTKLAVIIHVVGAAVGRESCPPQPINSEVEAPTTSVTVPGGMSLGGNRG